MKHRRGHTRGEPARLTPTPEARAARARAVLEERARLLARPLEQQRAQGERIDLVTFDLSRERYGIEARYVREIARLTDLTPVPGTPAFVAGITSRRGEIVAVFDLRELLGVGTSGLGDLSRLIVLGEESVELGVLADDAHDVVRIEVSEIGKAASGSARGGAYRRGVTKDGLLVLDAAAILADRRLFVDAAEERGAPGAIA